jgi:hypothetical protein
MLCSASRKPRPRLPSRQPRSSRRGSGCPSTASVLQASTFRDDVALFRLNATALGQSGLEPAFRRNTAARVYTSEAAHNPEVAGSNPAPATGKAPETGPFLFTGRWEPTKLLPDFCPLTPPWRQLRPSRRRHWALTLGEGVESAFDRFRPVRGRSQPGHGRTTTRSIARSTCCASPEASGIEEMLVCARRPSTPSAEAAAFGRELEREVPEPT